MLKLLRHVSPKAFFNNTIFLGCFFQAEHKIQYKRAAGFRIHFFATRTILRLTHNVCLPAYKNHTIHSMMFVLALNDAENIPLPENTIVVHVSFTHISRTSIQRYRQLADTSWPYTLTIRAISRKLFNVEGLSRMLLTRFKSLYMNMYHIGPSDGTV